MSFTECYVEEKKDIVIFIRKDRIWFYSLGIQEKGIAGRGDG